MKPGASFHDKARAVKMFNDPDEPKTVEQIATLLNLKPEHVEAIVKPSEVDGDGEGDGDGDED